MAPSIPRLQKPLTVTDFMALDELSCHFELQEGSLVLAPSPMRRHQLAVTGLAWQIAAQLPANLVVLPGVDVDVELSPPDQPGTCRRPDLVVLNRAAGLNAGGRAVRAAEVIVAIEITADGSRRMNHIHKRAEYAAAGIPHYWIIDLDDPVSLLECHLDGQAGYTDSGQAVGRFTAAVPFPVIIDLVRCRAGG